MGSIVFFSLTLVNIIGTILKMYHKVFVFLSIMLMWILFGWNNNNPDYYNYERWYNIIYYSDGFILEGKDLGYKLLMNITSIIGLDYSGFLIVVSILGFLLINSTVKKFSTNQSYVYLLYLVYPFFLDVVQVRNFLMMAVIIYSIRFLLEDTNISRVKYLMFLILAISIHSAALLYLPLILINKENKNNLIRIIVAFSLFFSLIIFLNGNKIPFIQNILDVVIDNEYIIGWFDKSTNFGFLLFFGMHLLTFFIIKYSRELVFKRRKNINEIHVKFVSLVYWIIVIGFIWFPFYMVSIEFTRLIRNLFLLNFIVFTITNKALIQERIELKVFYNFIVFGYVLFFFIIQIYNPHLDTVIKSVLEYNNLWP